MARRLGGGASVWHYLLVIALLPSVGLSVVAGLLAAHRVEEAAAARAIDQAMASIQRLDELHLAVDGEATAAAVGLALNAIGLTREQAAQLAGYVDATTPEAARRVTDAALTAAASDPQMSAVLKPVRAAIAEARRTDTDASHAQGEQARGRAWTVIQSYRAIVRGITDVQIDAAVAIVTGRRGSGTEQVLRAADQLQAVTELTLLGSIWSSDFFLTYLAPASELPGLRRELEDIDAAYRLRVDNIDSHLSPALRQQWQRFAEGSTVQLLDKFVTGNITRGGTPPLRELFVTGRSIKDYNGGLSALIAAAVTEGRAAAAADREASTDLARWTVTGTAVLLAVTIGILLLLGGRIRHRLGALAGSAQRLSAGRLEPMPVLGPREIALASAGLNDAVVTLRQVAATAERLAAGDLGAPELRRATPGPLGAAMHTSVELLTDAIRERERLQRELQHQAAHDSLTGLSNRAEAERLLTATLQRSAAADPPRRIGLLFVDLDHFKEVNDTHGHHAGDHVLQVSAARMVAEVRESDTVCRLGGDEFVVILDPAESDQVVSTIGHRIVAALGRSITYGAHELRIGASVGVAVTAPTGDAAADSEELLTRADRAVYRAKAAGRNGLAF